MSRRGRRRTIRLNRILWYILMLLMIIFSGLLYARFQSLGKTTEAAAEAVEIGRINTETEAVELFGKRLNFDNFQELVRDEDAIYTVMSSYYDERSDTGKEYGNLHTWSQEGVTDGSYFVYTAYEVTLEGIDTPVPSLSWVYLQTGEDGSLYFSDVSEDELVQELIENVRSSEAGQTLISLAQEAYEEAVESDDALAQYMNTYQETNAQQEVNVA